MDLSLILYPYFLDYNSNNNGMDFVEMLKVADCIRLTMWTAGGFL